MKTTKLTPKQLRALDAWIAQHLFGWTPKQVKAGLALEEISKKWNALPRKDSFFGLGLAGEYERMKAQADNGEVPKYSTDICLSGRLLACLMSKVGIIETAQVKTGERQFHLQLKYDPAIEVEAVHFAEAVARFAKLALIDIK